MIETPDEHPIEVARRWRANLEERIAEMEARVARVEAQYEIRRLSAERALEPDG